jgi:hypothetical protein
MPAWSWGDTPIQANRLRCGMGACLATERCVSVDDEPRRSMAQRAEDIAGVRQRPAPSDGSARLEGRPWVS